MTNTEVCASIKYNVLIGQDILKNCGEHILSCIEKCKAAVISDDKVFSLYGDTVIKSLENSGFSTESFVFPNGEKSKNIKIYSSILEFLAEKRFSRTDIIVALGGGVTGDMAGFAAATFLRGIRFVQIPTTILAAVDSSVGGKTAIDLCGGKNLAGAFHQPSLVLCDTDCFKTLDNRQVSCGYAEVIKYGVICDKEFFTSLKNKTVSIEDTVKKCVEIKRDIVSEDEFDNGKRKLLNFGHTLGHSVEKCSDYALTHGEAVAIGMMMITKISEKCGYAKEKISGELSECLKNYDLPTDYSISKHDMMKYLYNDKKIEGDTVTIIVPEKIGKSTLKKVKLKELESLADLCVKGEQG